MTSPQRGSEGGTKKWQFGVIFKTYLGPQGEGGGEKNWKIEVTSFMDEEFFAECAKIYLCCGEKYSLQIATSHFLPLTFRFVAIKSSFPLLINQFKGHFDLLCLS